MKQYLTTDMVGLKLIYCEGYKLPGPEILNNEEMKKDLLLNKATNKITLHTNNNFEPDTVY